MTYNEYLENKWPYQEEGHLFLLEVKHGCLYYKPGKGKTYPCIEALRDVDAYYNGNAKVLILSTADAIKNMWKTEIVPQSILPKNTTLMTTSAAIVETRRKELLLTNWNVIIVDECHKIKSNTSKISKLVYLLTRKCEYVWGLSGTPRGNTDIDIFCQFHNLNISEWGTISYSRFIDTCCDVDKKFFNGQQIRIPTGIKKEYQAGWERNIAMYTRRADYDEDDEMPDIEVNTIKIPYVPTKQYLDAESGVIQLTDYESTMTKLAAITKLHQAANGFLYYVDKNGTKSTALFEESKKLQWIKENLKNEPTLIVYRFEADYEQLTTKALINTLFTDNINDFKQGKAKVLLLQCSRCESFNLQMCKRIIFYTMDYSFIKYNQMIHRVWRKGQSEKVEIIVLLMENTIEEKIWKSVKNKENLSQLFYSIKGN